MDLHLKDKVVAITGGSEGIGYATTKGFLEEGSKVAICGRNAQKLEKAKKELGEMGYEVLTVQADVGKAEDIKAFADRVVEEYGTIDVWINNVSRLVEKSILETTPEFWDDIMKTNLGSVVFGTKAAAEVMKESGGGAIINTSSVASILPSVYKSSYGAPKFAVTAFTQISAGELAPFGIRVNAVAPGSTNTTMARNSGRDYSKLTKSHCIQRLGEPEEIANAFLFLASDRASFITGIVLPVTGGKGILQDSDKAYQEMR